MCQLQSLKTIALALPSFSLRRLLSAQLGVTRSGVVHTSHECPHRGHKVDESCFYARVIALATKARFCR
jgi:hypothetical protein